MWQEALAMAPHQKRETLNWNNFTGALDKDSSHEKASGLWRGHQRPGKAGKG